MAAAPPAAERIREEIARRGWSQNELAEKLGVSSGTLSRWLDGSRRMTRVDLALKLQGLLGVDPLLWSAPASESGEHPALDASATGTDPHTG